MPQHPKTGDIYAVGQRLPMELAMKLAAEPAGMGGLLDFEAGLIILKLDGPTKAEMKALKGKCVVRVGDFGRLMIVSPRFSGLNFDLIWSPIIAKLNGGIWLEELTEGDRILLNIVTVDENMVVRVIRSASLGPKTSAAIARIQRELLARRLSRGIRQYPQVALLDLPEGAARPPLQREVIAWRVSAQRSTHQMPRRHRASDPTAPGQPARE